MRDGDRGSVEEGAGLRPELRERERPGVVEARRARLAVAVGGNDLREPLAEEPPAQRLPPQVKLEVGCDGAQLAQGARLELAHALAGDPEAGADLLERLRLA